MTLAENSVVAGPSSARHPFLDLYLRHHLSMWPAQQMMAADSGMETCTSPEITDSRKRPLDGDVENGETKRSHYGGGNVPFLYIFNGPLLRNLNIFVIEKEIPPLYKTNSSRVLVQQHTNPVIDITNSYTQKNNKYLRTRNFYFYYFFLNKKKSLT